MNEILNFQEKIIFLKMVNDIYIQKNFLPPPNKIKGENEKIIAIANDYEKAIFTAREKAFIEEDKLTKQIKSLKQEVEISPIYLIKKLKELDEKIFLAKNIKKALNGFFWITLYCRLYQEARNWKNIAIRQDWQIVVFNKDENSQISIFDFL